MIANFILDILYIKVITVKTSYIQCDILIMNNYLYLFYIFSATRSSGHGFAEGDLFKTEGSQKEVEGIEHDGDDDHDDHDDGTAMEMVMLVML